MLAQQLSAKTVDYGVHMMFDFTYVSLTCPRFGQYPFTSQKHKLSDMNDKSFVDHMMCTVCYEWIGNLDVTPPCFLGAALSEH